MQFSDRRQSAFKFTADFDDEYVVERFCRDKNVSDRESCQFRIGLAPGKCMKSGETRVAFELRYWEP